MKSININSNINLYYIPMTKLKTTTIDVYIHRDLNEEDRRLTHFCLMYLKEAADFAVTVRQFQSILRSVRCRNRCRSFKTR